MGSIGQTFFLLNPSETSLGNQIIEMSYSRNRTTPLLDHKLPDNLLFSDNRKCYFAPLTRVANNVKDFQERYADRFNLREGVSVVDSFNEEVRWAYAQMEAKNRSI